MPSFRIEKNNAKIPGHSGFGRITLIGRNTISNKTEKQASQIIGEQIIKGVNIILEKEHLDTKSSGVEVEIIFKTYKRQ